MEKKYLAIILVIKILKKGHMICIGAYIISFNTSLIILIWSQYNYKFLCILYKQIGH